MDKKIFKIMQMTRQQIEYLNLLKELLIYDKKKCDEENKEQENLKFVLGFIDTQDKVLMKIMDIGVRYEDFFKKQEEEKKEKEDLERKKNLKVIKASQPKEKIEDVIDLFKENEE